MTSDAKQFQREDRYLAVLWIALACYAVVGKGFAYLGVPPIFIGEVLLLIGIWFWINRRLTGLNSSSPVQLLLIGYMLWGALRTIPDVSQYGVDALRDAVVWGYGLFALIVAGLLASRPQHLRRLLTSYRGFAKVFIAIMPLAFLLGTWGSAYIPLMPGSGVPIFGPFKTGDVMVHLTGAFAYLSVGALSAGVLRPWMIVAMGMNLVANFNGRAGLLALVCGASLVTALRPVSRLTAAMLGVGSICLIILWVTGLSVELPSSGRSISFQQVLDNVSSIGGDSTRDELGGSKRWRLQWWDTILNYTLHGRYFWTGKGFGINLANADGFQVAADESLRSPHNGHLTILARAGVPGFALWAVMQFAWALSLFDAFVRAARAREQLWAGLFAFLLAYWVAFMVNIAFDVFLEGPVGGIWFWCLFGIGMAAVRIYRESPELLQDTAATTRAISSTVPSKFLPHLAAVSARQALPAPIKLPYRY